MDRSCSSHIFCTGEIPIYVLIKELKCSFTQNVLEKQQKYKTILLHYDWYLLTIANPDGYQETWNGLREDFKEKSRVKSENGLLGGRVSDLFHFFKTL